MKNNYGFIAAIMFMVAMLIATGIDKNPNQIVFVVIFIGLSIVCLILDERTHRAEKRNRNISMRKRNVRRAA
jgi:uncharacterized membrane protein